MENVGEWNMALGFWFASMVALPIVLKICIWIFETIKLPEVHIVTVEKPVYKDRVVKQPIYRDRVVYKDRIVKKTVYRQRKVTQNKPFKKTQSVAPIHQTVIATLSTLGCKKKDAKTLVASLTANKNYEDDESLLKDCLTKL